MTKELPPHENLSLTDIEGEVWKDIEGFEGYYQISNFGRVKSSKMLKTGRIKEIIRKIQKRNTKRGKALSVSLIVNNAWCTKVIPRLVYETFIQKTKNYIFHKDNNYLNNNVNNLIEYTSYQYSENEPLKGHSKYFGTSKNRHGYYMKVMVRGDRVCEYFSKMKYNNPELEAAKKYDYYVKKYKLNRELNFPDEI